MDVLQKKVYNCQFFFSSLFSILRWMKNDLDDFVLIVIISTCLERPNANVQNCSDYLANFFEPFWR